MWSRHDRVNGWSDSRADRALETFTPIRRVMSAALKVVAIKRYFTVNRECDDATVQMLSPERWAGRLVPMRAAASATVVNTMLFGWLATMTVRARRGVREALLTTQCRLGCPCEETNWHVLAEGITYKGIRNQGIRSPRCTSGLRTLKILWLIYYNTLKCETRLLF